MDNPNWSLRSMDLDGYKEQVRKRLREYGHHMNSEPSDRLYLEAWTLQRCAKGLAASFMRRERKMSRP